ncbi:MAG: hypothetical protein ACXITR_03255 [Cyanobacterium sp.]
MSSNIGDLEKELFLKEVEINEKHQQLRENLKGLYHELSSALFSNHKLSIKKEINNIEQEIESDLLSLQEKKKMIAKKKEDLMIKSSELQLAFYEAIENKKGIKSTNRDDQNPLLDLIEQMALDGTDSINFDNFYKEQISFLDKKIKLKLIQKIMEDILEDT